MFLWCLVKNNKWLSLFSLCMKFSRYMRETKVSATSIQKTVGNLFSIRLLIGLISDAVATKRALLVSALTHFLALIVIKQSYHAGSFLLASYHCLIYVKDRSPCFQKIRQPPTFPQGRPCSILGRIRLNLRVRDGYGCFPYPHRHRKNCYAVVSTDDN